MSLPLISNNIFTHPTLPALHRWSIQTNKDQTLMVFHLEDSLDPWIEAYTGSTFNIHVRAGLKPRDTSHPQPSGEGETHLQDYHFVIQSSMPSPRVLGHQETRGDYQLTPRIKFCACDMNSICFEHAIALSHLHPYVNICLVGPENTKLKVSSLRITGSNFIYPNPRLFVEYDSSNRNRAYVSGEMLRELLDVDSGGLTIVGTTTVSYDDGRKGETGFFVPYVMNELVPQRMVGDGFEGMTSLRLTRASRRSQELPDVQVCQCNQYNMCEEKSLRRRFPNVRLCLLAQDSTIEHVASMGLALTSGTEHTVRGLCIQSSNLSFFILRLIHTPLPSLDRFNERASASSDTYAQIWFKRISYHH